MLDILPLSVCSNPYPKFLAIDQLCGDGTKDSNGNIDDLSTRGWNTTSRNLIDQAPRMSRRSNIEPTILDENATSESVEVADTDIAAKEDGDEQSL